MGYPGSKSADGVFQRIIGQIPPHSVYVEPFFGSGQIFHRKRRALNSIVIDKSPEALDGLPDDESTEVIWGDALEWLPLLSQRKLIRKGISQPFLKDALIYCDPPYLLSTRKGRHYYEHEMTDADHVKLISILKSIGCRVLLSGYPSELYASKLREWRCLRYSVMTRGGKKVECLWANFPEPETLHDWRFAGRTFRERLSFKRLAARWLARLEAMPPIKRGYVLESIARGIPAGSADPGAAVRSARVGDRIPGLTLAAASDGNGVARSYRQE